MKKEELFAKLRANTREQYDMPEMPMKGIEYARYQFGTFISGPSKTADIEQALVMGAQAARSVTVIVLE